MFINHLQECGEYKSTTEKYAILRVERYKEIKVIEDALTVLNKSERILVEETYFQVEKPTIDNILCERVGCSRRNYYRVKRKVLEKMAYVMGLK